MRCFVLQEQQQAIMRLTGLFLPPVILLEFVSATAFNEVTGPFPLKPVSRMQWCRLSMSTIIFNQRKGSVCTQWSLDVFFFFSPPNWQRYANGQPREKHEEKIINELAREVSHRSGSSIVAIMDPPLSFFPFFKQHFCHLMWEPVLWKVQFRVYFHTKSWVTVPPVFLQLYRFSFERSMCWLSPPEEITASWAQKQGGECLLNKCCHSQISLPGLQVEDAIGTLWRAYPECTSFPWLFRRLDVYYFVPSVLLHCLPVFFVPPLSCTRRDVVFEPARREALW